MKMLVCSAGGRSARESAGYIVKVARSLDAAIVALHVSRPGEPREVGDDAVGALASACKEANLAVTGYVRDGDVVATIVSTADEEQPQLILMGPSQGRFPEEWLSTRVMQATDVPVVVVPPAVGGKQG
jgi:nucleotide-binding universal stress UspA family protein